MAEQLNLSSGHGLNLERAEALVANLGNDPALRGSVDIDLAHCRHIDVGAGWRLGNALRRPGKNCRLRVAVPDPGDFHGYWFQNFTRSGLGFAISRYANVIIAEDQDVTARIKQYYASGSSRTKVADGLEGHLWDAQNFCMVTSLDRGIFSSEEVGDFSSVVLQLLRRVSFEPEAYAKEDISCLLDLLFQSVQNVYDHASKKPLAPKVNIFSYLSMRYYRQIDHAKSETQEFTGYLDGLRSMPLSYDFVGFIEFVVNDDGVGMAARHSQSQDIYWGSIDQEAEAIGSALAAGNSVKPLSRDARIRGDSGFGMSRIEAALIRLRAFASLRTGRLEICLDPFRSKSFSLKTIPLGYMPGTTLQVILPCRKNVLWSSN